MDAVTALEQAELERYRARTPTSAALHRRAAESLPGGDTRTGTFHAPYPLFLTEGRGCRLRDADGHEYLDFLNNFTSLIHGHGHPGVTEAVTKQLGAGTVHGSATGLQVELAEEIRARFPAVERLRFCNSGTEATLFALRAAKAFTGRARIMKMAGGYHGSHDQVAVAMAPPYRTDAVLGLSPGAIGEVILGTFNDLEATAALIRRHRSELAAVIVEPMMGAGGGIVAEPGFLAGLREVTEECGVLLIVDEIITFRLGYGGLQGHFGVRPDLTTFGKVIGGGFPVGAFGGRTDVMATYDPTRPGTISHSGTYNGNAVTMAAGLATLAAFGKADIAGLNRAGDELRAGLNAALADAGVPGCVAGYGSVMQLHFHPGPVRTIADADGADRRLLRIMHLAMLNRGIFAPSRQMYVLSTAHGPAEFALFRDAFRDALTTIAAAREPLHV